MSHCLCNTNSVTRRLIKSHNESLFVQHKQTALQEEWTRVMMSHCLCNTNSVTRRMDKSHNESLFVQHKQRYKKTDQES